MAEQQNEIQDVLNDVQHQAMVCWAAGRTEEAEMLWRGMLELSPGHPQANFGLGQIMFASGRLQDAHDAFLQACDAAPEHAEYWLALASTLLQLTKFDDVIAVLEAAIGAGLDDPEAKKMLATAIAAKDELAHRKREPEMLAELRQLADKALKTKPKRLEKEILSVISEAERCYVLKQWQQMGQVCRNALAEKPSVGKLWHYLGISYLMKNEFSFAAVALEKATSLSAKDAEAWDHRGVAERELGHFDNAERCFKRSLMISPGRVDTLVNLGNLRTNQERLDEAISCFEAVLSIQGKSVMVLVNLARAYNAKNDRIRAIRLLQQAKLMDPNRAEVRHNLGLYLQKEGCLRDSISELTIALSLEPMRAATHMTLAMSQYALLNFDAALASIRRAVELSPHNVEAWGRYLFLMLHVDSVSPEDEARAYFSFGELLEAGYRDSWPKHTNSRDKNRRLKVGLVSADLKNHAVASFIEPVLDGLSESDISFFAYSNAAVEDDTSDVLRKYFAKWVRVFGRSDDWIFDQINDDGIDILVDLSGLTAGNKLGVFARKPAPIQATWIGLPVTTGLKAIDYYLTDEKFIPCGLVDHLFSEKIVRMPSGVLFKPHPCSPEVNALPALSTGKIVFCSFSSLRKINDLTINIWCQILQSVPDSVLLLAGLLKEELSDEVRNAFMKKLSAYEGLSNRVILRQRSNMTEYLGLHHQIDLVLDTFPYSGGTTTCHALWMGVPVVTLSGRTSVSRTTCGLNAHAGLEKFNTLTPAGYVECAIYWANHLDELAEIRRVLRPRFGTSLVCRTDIASRYLEKTFRTMWVRWCEGFGAESFFVK